MNIKPIIGAVSFTLKKWAPEILLGIGITGIGAGTILACKATLKAESILDQHQECMDIIEEALCVMETTPIDYSLEDAKKDRIITTTNTIISFVKLYGPPITLIGASIGCILGAHHIMSKRNVALMAAYKVVEELFNQYRGRVVNELGEEKDAHFMYGTNCVSTEEIQFDSEGKKKKVKKQKEELIPGVVLSGFARTFEKDIPDQHGSWIGSTQWSPVHDYNLSFLEMKELYFNDRLCVKGFVTINDVYEQLGFPTTEAGMVCGWRYKSDRGDGYISFRPYLIDGNWVSGRDGDSIILDFNIDGVIFDQNHARKELS